jgi:4-alpha-glucanotransferase
MTQKDINGEDRIMWEKKSSGEFVKKTEKAVRKFADKKTESIDRTAEWMKIYQYAQWPANPDTLEVEMKNKITATLSEEMRQEPAFLAWVLYQVAGELAANLEVKAIWE